MSKKYDNDIIQISGFAKALSHPLRVYIMKKLSKINTCFYSGDIAKELNIGRSTLSQHLKELKHAGLIQGKIEAPYIKYCINRQNWEKANSLYHKFFEEQQVAKEEEDNQVITK